VTATSDPATAILTALTGSATPGTYPDTVHDRLDAALVAAWAASAGLNLTVPTSGGAPGPYRAAGANATDPWSIVVDQATARFGTEPKARTLTEKAQLLAVLVAGIDAHRAPPPGSATPPLPTGTGQGTLTWAADLTQADVQDAGFKATPWNTEHGPPWPPPIGAAPQGTDGGPRSGRAIRFSLEPGGKRIEVEPDVATFGAGQDAWIGLRLYFAPGFPLAIDDWQVITQFHGADVTSPQQCVQVRRGKLSIADGHSFGPTLVTGQWYALVVRFSADPHGTTSAWLDDVPVLSGYAAGLNNLPLYWKTGYYRDPAITTPGTVWQAGHALGTGYGAVRPS
jgi:hypothetical protein